MGAVFFLIIMVGIYRSLINIVLGDYLISIVTLDGDGSKALSHPGNDLSVDGDLVPFGPTAIHKPIKSIYYIIEKG